MQGRKGNQLSKTKIDNIQNKMLDSSVVISGMYEDKWEKDESQREKLNKTMEKIQESKTEEEKFKKASEI